MSRLWKRRTQPGRLSPPDDTELLAYLDGQLHTERHAEIEKMLAESWEIRLQLAELGRDIETYTQATSELVSHEVPPFEDFWKGAPAESAALHLSKEEVRAGSSPQTSQSSRPQVFPPWLRMLTQLRLPSVSLALVAAILLIVTLVFVVRMNWAPPVSAKEVLRRSMSAEDQRVREVSVPVIYQKLKVRRSSALSKREESVTWEIWSDPGNRRFRQRIADARDSRFVADEDRPGYELVPQGGPAPELVRSARAIAEGNPESPALPPVLTELETIYRANQIDQRRPLSVAGFEAWRRLANRQTEEVTKTKTPDGAAAFLVAATAKGPGVPNSIVRNELVVRAEDWHPVEQRLRVQAADGIENYQVTESAFQVVALSRLDASIFAEFSPPPPTIAGAMPPIAASAESPNSANVLAAEIEAQYALHRVKACMGESIEILPTPSGKIEVRGLVDSPKRKEEVLTALRGVPFVSLNLQSLEEATNARSVGRPGSARGKPGSSTSSTAESTITVPPARLAIEAQLERYFASRGGSANLRIAEVSTEAVSLSRVALSDAWALRHLAETFGPARTSQLRVQSKWLLEVMLRDHIRSLQTQLSRSQTLLEPILSSLANRTTAANEALPTPAATSASVPAWNIGAAGIFTDTEQIDRLTNGLFAGGDLPDDNPEQAIHQLLASFAASSNRFRDLESSMGFEFSGNPNQLSVRQRQE